MLLDTARHIQNWISYGFAGAVIVCVAYFVSDGQVTVCCVPQMHFFKLGIKGMAFYDDEWFWAYVSCALFICVVGLLGYLWWRKQRFFTVEGEVLPLTTKDCGGAEHTLIYASQAEIQHLEDNFREGRKGEPFVLPNGQETKVKCYAPYVGSRADIFDQERVFEATKNQLDQEITNLEDQLANEEDDAMREALVEDIETAKKAWWSVLGSERRYREEMQLTPAPGAGVIV